MAHNKIVLYIFYLADMLTPCCHTHWTMTHPIFDNKILWTLTFALKNDCPFVILITSVRSFTAIEGLILHRSSTLFFNRNFYVLIIYIKINFLNLKKMITSWIFKCSFSATSYFSGNFRLFRYFIRRGELYSKFENYF